MKGPRPLAMAEDVRHSIAITAKSRLAKAQRSSKLEGSRSLLVSRTPTGRGRGLESGSPVVDQGIRVGPKLHADAKNRSRSVVQWTSERDSERDQGLGGDSEDLKAKPNIVAAIRHVSARMFKRGAVPLLAHWPESCEAGCAGFWSLGRRLCGEPPSAIPPSDAAASATRWLRFGVLAEAGSPVVLHFVLMSTLWAGFFFATLVSIPAIILIAAAKASSSDGGEGLGAAELLFQQSGALASFSLHSLVSSSTVATASANSTGASVLQFADTKVVQDASLAAIGGPDTVDVRWVTLIVSFVDSLGALILMTCVSRFRTAVKVAMAVSAGRSIDLGAFSVVIRNLPPDATEDGLVEHLASLFRLDGDGDWVDPFCLKFQRRKGEKQAAFGEAPDPPDDEDEDEDESHGDDEGIQRKSTSGRAGAQGRAARHDVVYKVQGDTVEDDTDAARVANAPIANATVALPGGRKSGWIADAMAVPPVAEAWDIQARAEAVEGQLSRAKENVEFLEARTASLGKSCIDKLKLWYWERQASKLLEESQQLQSEHVAAELDPSERPAAFVVTFNNAASRDRCLADFAVSSMPGCACLQPHALRMPTKYVASDCAQGFLADAARMLDPSAHWARPETVELRAAGRPGGPRKSLPPCTRCRRACSWVYSCVTRRTSQPRDASEGEPADHERELAEFFALDPVRRTARRLAASALMLLHLMCCDSPCRRICPGRWAISAHPASQPLPLLWRAIVLSDCALAARRAMVCLATTVLLMATVVAVVVLEGGLEQSDDVFGIAAETSPLGADACSTLLPAAAMGKSVGAATFSPVLLWDDAGTCERAAKARSAVRGPNTSGFSVEQSSVAFAWLHYVAASARAQCAADAQQLAAETNSTHWLSWSSPTTRSLVASDASPAAPSDGQLPVAITARASAGLSTFSAQRTGGGSSLAVVRPGAGADWGGVANCLKGAGLPDSLAGGEVLVSADGSAVLLADPCAGLCGSGIADGDDDQICVLWADGAKTVSSVVADIDAGDGTLPGDPLGTYGADLLVMCVCASRLLKGGVQGLEAASELQTAAACDAVTSASAASQIEVLGLAVVLGIVGMATESSMLRLGEEEGFFASDQREAMIAQRLALVQVGNFLIPLLLGMNVPVMSTMLPDWNPVGNGDYRIASPPWFGDVASPIAIAVVLELFMEGATAAANAMCCRRLWAMQAAWRSRTQGELLEKIEPEDFLASALTSRAVFLAISAELMRPAYPSLGFVGGMGFCALYWADLYRALRVDSAPDTVASAATALFAARILLALGVARSVLAIFIYSDDAVMPSWRYSDFLTAASSAVGVDAQEAVSMPLILDRVVNTPPLAVAAFVILKFVVFPPLWAVAKPIISSTICAPCIALLARAKARTAKVTISSAKPFVPPLCGEMWVQLGAPATRMHPAVLNAADIQDGWRYASDTTRGMGGEWALVKIITGIDVAAKRQALLSLEQGRAIRGTDATTSMSPAESRQLSRVGSMVNNWTKEGAAHAASPSMMLRSKHKKRHKALAVDIPEPPKLPRTIPCKDGAGPNGTGEFRTAVPSGARKLTWEVIASRGPTSYRASMRGESTLAQAVRLWSKACEVAKDKRAAAERAAAGASQASSARRLGPGGAAAGASPKASPGSAEGATPKGRSKRRGIKSPLAKSALGIDTKVAPADLAILDF